MPGLFIRICKYCAELYCQISFEAHFCVLQNSDMLSLFYKISLSYMKHNIDQHTKNTLTFNYIISILVPESEGYIPETAGCVKDDVLLKSDLWAMMLYPEGVT